MSKKPQHFCRSLLLLLFSLAGASNALAQADSVRGVFGAGGGESSGGNYTLTGTVGQAAVGPSSGISHEVELGFWYVPGGQVSAVDLPGILPPDFNLEQNHPNPFNPATSIGFAVPRQSRVSIKLYNLRGYLVKNIVDQDFEPGWHVVTFDGKELSSGVYFCQMVAGDFTETRKMTLMK